MKRFILAIALLCACAPAIAGDEPVFKYYAVIKYTDPPRKVWFGPYVRYGTAANVVAAHERKGRSGKVVNRESIRKQETK